jgi:hypothetical protein
LYLGDLGYATQTPIENFKDNNNFVSKQIQSTLMARKRHTKQSKNTQQEAAKQYLDSSSYQVPVRARVSSLLTFY